MNPSTRLNLLKSLNLEADYFRDYKINQIEQLVEKYKDLPKQGTAEWLKLREFSFGGSEIAGLIGANEFSSVKASIKEKLAVELGIPPFSGNLYTRWGNMMEEITENIVKKLFGGKIWELSSIPGFCDNHRYSPDGIGVFKFNCQTIIDGVLIKTVEYLSVLLEYKSPFSKIPLGVIPKHYLPQIKIGMCDFSGLVDFGLFINNSIRKCRLQDFKFDATYDLNMHKPYDDEHLPIAAGIIVFRQTKEQLAKMDEWLSEEYGEDSKNVGDDSDSDSSDDSDSANKFIDFGASNPYDFDDLTRWYMKRYVTAEYGEPLIFESELSRIPFMVAQHPNIPERDIDKHNLDMKKFKESINILRKNDSTIIGCLPWKLFISDMIVQMPDNSFKSVVEPKIKKCVEILKNIRAPIDGLPPCSEIIEKRFNSYFSK